MNVIVSRFRVAGMWLHGRQRSRDQFAASVAVLCLVGPSENADLGARPSDTDVGGQTKEWSGTCARRSTSAWAR